MTACAYAPVNYPRRWLPEDVVLKTWEQIEPRYRQLLERPIESPDALEQWLFDVGELNAAVGQEGVERYIAMTCQTDDPQRESAYLEFVRDIEPKLKPLQNAIRECYLDSPHRKGLDRDRYQVFDRAQENRRALYREANIPRETELAELEQQYQKIIGAMTVEFQGQERTPAQMAPFLEEHDRGLRQAAWELVALRRLADKETLDDLFDRMIKLRVAIAREAGFSSFVDYAFRYRERFDYGVAETIRFQEAIERVVVPLARRLQEERRRALGVETLRPWDLAVDPLGRPPLRPFSDVETLAEGTEAIFNSVDPELGQQFAYLRAHGLLDLANRKGKAPGGYQTTLEDDRLPFIFMNAVGLDGDVRTLLHEGGHAFHALASRGEPLAAYRESPIEFCEVASMAMELLGAKNLERFYHAEDANRSYRQLLEGIVLILPWIATVDAFQHWIYNHPDHGRDERRDAWMALLDRFGGIVDWSGYDDARAHYWHRQLHIFLYPFYYIEYGIAQLGALQIWRRSLSDRDGAVAAYRRALAVGGGSSPARVVRGGRDRVRVPRGDPRTADRRHQPGARPDRSLSRDVRPFRLNPVGGSRPAEPLDQLLQIDRLGQKSFGLQLLYAVEPTEVIRTRRHHDPDGAVLGTDRGQDHGAVAVGEHQVEHDAVGILVEQEQCLGDGRDVPDVPAASMEDPSEGLLGRLVILDQE